MSLKPYPEMKPSHIEWFGDIPVDWTISRLRFITECCDGQRVPLNSAQRADVPGDVPYWGANAIMDFVREHIFDEELVLLGEDGAPFFDKLRPVAFYSTGRVWPNNHIHVLRISKKVIPSFLVHVLNITEYSHFIDGSTRDKLTQGAMSQIPVPLPPLFEQRAITAFLDRETAKIDALVAEQERLIALLAEKRRAIISHAVTKGLDPDAPMKDSGIEWLGEVPAHWELARLGAQFREVRDEGAEGLPILSVSIHDGVSDRELGDDDSDRKVTRSDDVSKYRRVEPGDLVYNMMRAWQGGFGAVTVSGMVSPAYVICRPTKSILTNFVEQLLRTPRAVEEMRRNSKGITDFRLRLYWDEFKNIKVAMPPEHEQQSIMGFVTEEVTKFATLAAEAERAIDLLKERRAALISAAVTGKIDVREAVDAEEAAA